MSFCVSCKKMKMKFDETDDGVGLVNPSAPSKCIELMKEHKEDFGDIFEDWDCPEFEWKGE